MSNKRLSQEYRDYIVSEAWRRKRALKLYVSGGRSGFVDCDTCQNRVSVIGVEIHHLTYERLGHERLSDLAIECGTCHKLIVELEEMSDGADVMGMSPQLLDVLATIDKRLGLPVARRASTDPPQAKPGGPQTVAELNARLEAKRAELGIVLKDTGP